MVSLPHLKTVALSAPALLLVLSGAGGGAAPVGASARTSAVVVTPAAAALPTVTRRNPTVGLRSGRNCMLENGVDHGTFVAGIVAGRRTGVAPKAKLVSVGALAGCEGVSPESEAEAVARVVRALDWVAANAA